MRPNSTRRLTTVQQTEENPTVLAAAALREVAPRVESLLNQFKRLYPHQGGLRKLYGRNHAPLERVLEQLAQMRKLAAGTATE